MLKRFAALSLCLSLSLLDVWRNSKTSVTLYYGMWLLSTEPAGFSKTNPIRKLFSEPLRGLQLQFAGLFGINVDWRRTSLVL